MKISEIMTSPVHTISPHATVTDLDELLAGRGISGALVVSEEGELLGLVSKTDTTHALVADPDLYEKETEVWEIMTPDVITAQTDDSIVVDSD